MKKEIFYFSTKKYPYDFKIEIIGVIFCNALFIQLFLTSTPLTETVLSEFLKAVEFTVLEFTLSIQRVSKSKHYFPSTFYHL